MYNGNDPPSHIPKFLMINMIPTNNGLIMDKKLTKSTKFDAYEINKHTLLYKLLLTTQ